MKSQDIGLLLRLISLEHQENSSSQDRSIFTWPHDWRDWESHSDNIGQHTFFPRNIDHKSIKHTNEASNFFLMSRP